MVYNFGVINYGVNGKFYFCFKNVGNELLIIEVVCSSCGCIVVIFLRELIVLGKSNEIIV